MFIVQGGYKEMFAYVCVNNKNCNDLRRVCLFYVTITVCSIQLYRTTLYDTFCLQLYFKICIENKNK